MESTTFRMLVIVLRNVFEKDLFKFQIMFDMGYELFQLRAKACLSSKLSTGNDQHLFQTLSSGIKID